jgi:hypothetical protein
LAEPQTSHAQPITGTPVDVPLPSMVTRRDMRRGSLAQGALGAVLTEPQLAKHLFRPACRIRAAAIEGTGS